MISALCLSFVFVRPQCPVRSLQDVTSGLLLCCLAVEYVSFSKRFVPELINFLAGTLHLAVKDKTSLGNCTFSQDRHVFVSSYVPNAKLIWLTSTLRHRLHRGAALQVVREELWPAAGVWCWIISELEQKTTASVWYTTSRAQDWPWQRSSQVGGCSNIHWSDSPRKHHCWFRCFYTTDTCYTGFFSSLSIDIWQTFSFINIIFCPSHSKTCISGS